MKTILLISNKVMDYRIPIYNYFQEKFREDGYNFEVIANQIFNPQNQKISFNYCLKDFEISSYLNFINSKKPNYIMLFLHLSDIILFPVIMYAKIKKIPIIYWHHGIDLQHPKSPKNLLYYTIHYLATAIILYFPHLKSYIKPYNYNKVFFANNTLGFNSFPSSVIPTEKIKNKYNIHHNKVILFATRIQPRKKLNVLLNLFIASDYGVVIVGEGITEEQKSLIDENENMYYLGPIYESMEINSIFAACDVFCIPGANGLSINHALYWGKPIVTMKGYQGPEVFLLRNGFNGYLVEDEKELKEKVILLLENRDVYEEFSKNAKKVIQEEGTLENMYRGFRDALFYCNQEKISREDL